MSPIHPSSAIITPIPVSITSVLDKLDENSPERTPTLPIPRPAGFVINNFRELMKPPICAIILPVEADIEYSTNIAATIAHAEKIIGTPILDLSLNQT